MRVRSAIVRPWLKAGLSALLLNDERRVAELRGEGQAVEVSVAPDVSSRTTDRARSLHQTVPAREASTFRRRERVVPEGAASRAERGSVAPPVAGSAAMPSESSGAGLLATPGARPVEAWPESWLALKNRRPLPPRPLVLWTYAGLGEDLTGKPDETRRRVIVRMLMELRHPGGTHVFWPCGLAGERAEDGPALFWSGVKLLNPRVLLLFGSDARDALSMPKTLLPFCQERVYGRLVIQLPRPQALAGDEASFKRALAFLSRLLRFCARRQAS